MNEASSMDCNKYESVHAEFARSGSVAPEIMMMDGYRLTSQSEVPEEVFLFKLFNTPCFPRGDLTTITGPAKSGKTFLVTMLMACCVERQVLAFERIGEEPFKVLWLDTEQSRMTTKRILTERVGRMIHGHRDVTDDAHQASSTGHQALFPDEQYYVLNVRSLTPKERVEMLRLAIETYRPDLVVIDGIADLLDDINSGTDSTTLIQQLLAMAVNYDCNITTIIHLNRSGERLNLRGWIGTLMVQKSYEVLNCEKVFRTTTFSADLTFSRRYHLDETLYYEINADGLPVATKKPDTQPRDEQGKFMSKSADVCQVSKEKIDTFNQRYIVRHRDTDSWEWDMPRLFADAMGNRAMVSRDDLKRLVMTAANIHAPKYYDKLFTLAVGQHIIQTTMDKSGRVVVIMP